MMMDVAQFRRERGDNRGAERIIQFSQWSNTFGTQRSIGILGYDIYNAQGMLGPLWKKLTKIVEMAKKLYLDRSDFKKQFDDIMKEVYEFVQEVGRVSYGIQGKAAHRFVMEAFEEFQEQYFLSDLYQVALKRLQRNFQRQNNEL
eukprot:TRINITY_DN83785_c0_g1_i1.p2 TRINITY_DN83785_c0_g1~~TRINITY_DN83785_c0_g1_i1.p2  ORF type:complete len:145 (+),score=9.00 TRINITY_DN83785_c0_g1_i1:3-437(+)